MHIKHVSGALSQSFNTDMPKEEKSACYKRQKYLGGLLVKLPTLIFAYATGKLTPDFVNSRKQSIDTKF